MFAPSVSSFATTQAAKRFRQEEVRCEFFWKTSRLRPTWQVKRPIQSVRGALRMKMCVWIFVWTIVTQEIAIWSVTIVKIRSYSTKTAIVTVGCLPHCRRIARNFDSMARKRQVDRDFIPYCRRNGRNFDSMENQGKRWMHCTIARYESTWLIAASWSVVHKNVQNPVRRPRLGYL